MRGMRKPSQWFRWMTTAAVADPSRRPENLLYRVELTNLCMSFCNVGSVMRRQVVTGGVNMRIRDAVKVMQRRRVGSIVVIDDEGRCIGIFTERDVIRSIADGFPLDTPIGEVMTKRPITIRADTSISEAKAIMVTHGIRHLPVVDDEGRVLGMVSVRDLLEGLLGIPTLR